MVSNDSWPHQLYLHDGTKGSVCCRAVVEVPAAGWMWSSKKKESHWPQSHWQQTSYRIYFGWPCWLFNVAHFCFATPCWAAGWRANCRPPVWLRSARILRVHRLRSRQPANNSPPLGRWSCSSYKKYCGVFTCDLYHPQLFTLSSCNFQRKLTIRWESGCESHLPLSLRRTY